MNESPSEPQRETHFVRLYNATRILEDRLADLSLLMNELEGGDIIEGPSESASLGCFITTYHNTPGNLNSMSERLAELTATLREMLI
jgi:hypothetical protein